MVNPPKINKLLFLRDQFCKSRKESKTTKVDKNSEHATISKSLHFGVVPQKNMDK